jgi:hypothetical protein
MPAAIAATEAGRHLAFLIDCLHSPRDLSDAEVLEHWVADEFSNTIEGRRRGLASWVSRLVAFTVTGYELPDPRLAIAGLASAEGQRYRLGVIVQAGDDARVRWMSLGVWPEGVTLRHAVESDGPALAEIERRAPIRLGDVSVVYDRGEADYFTGERLMGHARTSVVEQDGRPVGLAASVVHPLRIKGTIRPATYQHRVRLVPEARRSGAASMLVWATFIDGSLDADFSYALVAEENETVLRAMEAWRLWSVRPQKVAIDTAAQRGPPTGRTATPGDATRVAELLNATHAAEELFVPCTVESLAERLSREPRAYSWANVRLSDRAVVGVWPSAFRVLRDAGGTHTEDTRALILDYGFEPGAEAEFEALLRAVCAELADTGNSELSVFTSPPSPGNAVLLALAKRVEGYVAMMNIPEPPDLAARGIYIDQLYF